METVNTVQVETKDEQMVLDKPIDESKHKTEFYDESSDVQITLEANNGDKNN